MWYPGGYWCWLAVQNNPWIHLKRRQSEKGRREKWNLQLGCTFKEVASQLTDSAHLLPVVSVAVKNNPHRDHVRTIVKGDTAAAGQKDNDPDACVFVVYMSLLTTCRWVQVVGQTPLATHQTSPPPLSLTMGPHPVAKPSSCRFGYQCAILVFGHCVFREQVMNHSACSLVWTRGNPGNSGCRSKTVAGLGGLWWVPVAATQQWYWLSEREHVKLSKEKLDFAKNESI